MPMPSEKSTSANATPTWRAKRRAKWARERGTALRDSYIRGGSSGAIRVGSAAPKHVAHVGDHGDVQDQRGELDPGEPARELVELERNVDAAAYRGEPFRPGPRVP